MELFAHHVGTPPLPPSRRTELAVPESLDRIVLACLEKNPERRPASAEALADQLRGVQPLPPWTAERARRWWDMHLESDLVPKLSM
jgi:serine/threonine-protein kinase